jgi:16S rRNA (adenine1518-N6/adenine1519-N6)-dimethyltransferase
MTAIDDLPPLREAIRRHGLSAKKSLGQNFLLDLNLTARIARAGGPLDGITVVEIGPGPGGLTRALLAEGAWHVIAIERDSRAIAALGEIAAHYPGRLTVVEGDALEIDWRYAPAFSPLRNKATVFGTPPLEGEGRTAEGSPERGGPFPPPEREGREGAEELSPPPGPLKRADLPPPGGGGERRIVANLPYNVATALLVRWLGVEPWPPWFDALVLMFQREVAERIVAPPGAKQYGRLAVLAGWRTEAKIMFDVAPSAFVPPPKVISSVVRLVPRASPLPCVRATLERVTSAAFGQRRKMLRQSLRALGGDLHAILAAAGIDPMARAEEISVEAFVALANAFEAALTERR